MRNKLSRAIALAGCTAAATTLQMIPHAAHADPARFVGRPDLPLAQRVQRLEDIEEIHELMYAYGRDVDTKNFAALGELFAPDGTWGGDKGEPMKGPKGIRDGMEKAFGPVVWRGDFHVFTNAIIHLDGDRATALSKWQFVSPKLSGGTEVDYAGHYDDVFVRVKGHWKFLHRKVLDDIAPPPAKRK